MKTKLILLPVVALALFAAAPALKAQGMPKELHDNIHALFDNHGKFTRKVDLTKTGYVALTESKDPKLAKILREHVSQMRDRLQSGRMVRRWDPAFPEFIAHYDDITHRVEATRDGLKITVTGKTPEAIKVAQNHANIVSDFAKNGWKAHDRSHPLALTSAGDAKTATAGKPAGECAECRKDAAKQSDGRPCCLKETKGESAKCAACEKDATKKQSGCAQCRKDKPAQSTKP